MSVDLNLPRARLFGAVVSGTPEGLGLRRAGAGEAAVAGRRVGRRQAAT